jgi:hypothetical protein
MTRPGPLRDDADSVDRSLPDSIRDWVRNVRRIASRFGQRPPPPPPLQSPPSRRLEKIGKPAAAAAVPEAVIQRPILWRYVVGSFVVRIPSSTGEGMRIPEAMTLAIMKWRLAHVSPGNRWAPVLERYSSTARRVWTGSAETPRRCRPR